MTKKTEEMEEDINVTVVYPVKVTLKFDKHKTNDQNYIEEKRDEAWNLAQNQFFHIKAKNAVIHNADVPELIE